MAIKTGMAIKKKKKIFAKLKKLGAWRHLNLKKHQEGENK
jgi:hypothetical protein